MLYLLIQTCQLYAVWQNFIWFPRKFLVTIINHPGACGDGGPCCLGNIEHVVDGTGRRE